jgi:hypothetical protein
MSKDGYSELKILNENLVNFKLRINMDSFELFINGVNTKGDFKLKNDTNN